MRALFCCVPLQNRWIRRSVDIFFSVESKRSYAYCNSNFLFNQRLSFSSFTPSAPTASNAQRPPKWNKMHSVTEYLTLQQNAIDAVGFVKHRDKLQEEIQNHQSNDSYNSSGSLSTLIRQVGIMSKFLDGLSELFVRSQELQEIYSLALEEDDTEMLSECVYMLTELEADVRRRQIVECMRAVSAGASASVGDSDSSSDSFSNSSSDSSSRTSSSHCSYLRSLMSDGNNSNSHSSISHSDGTISRNISESDCFLHIQVGAGGDDACEWVEMLHSMYCGWCAEHGYRTEPVEEVRGDNSVGLRSVTMRVSSQSSGCSSSGDTGYQQQSPMFPYGWLHSEAGVHRLVRISPFDSHKRRHTSFAMVLIYPDYSDAVDAATAECLRPDQFVIETFRSSGPGGQSVNKTDSAVRITHRSTGLTVTCQNERSQAQNKKIAMSLLQSKIRRQLQTQSKETQKGSVIGNETVNSFGGGHVRSVVLHPYVLAKDHRTGWECCGQSLVQEYLSGRGDTLQSALEAHLFWWCQR